MQHDWQISILLLLLHIDNVFDTGIWGQILLLRDTLQLCFHRISLFLKKKTKTLNAKEWSRMKLGQTLSAASMDVTENVLLMLSKQQTLFIEHISYTRVAQEGKPTKKTRRPDPTPTDMQTEVNMQLHAQWHTCARVQIHTDSHTSCPSGDMARHWDPRPELRKKLPLECQVITEVTVHDGTTHPHRGHPERGRQVGLLQFRYHSIQN